MRGKKTGGRKKGVPNRASTQRAVAIAESGLTPLEFMLRIMRDDMTPEDASPEVIKAFAELRFEAAKAAAPYVHPRLAAVEHTGKDGGPIETTVTDSDLQRWLAFEATKSVIKKAQREPA